MPAEANDVYSSAHFALQLDGTVVGTLRSIDGGSVKTDVVSYQSGGHGDIWRQLAKTKYEPIKIVTALAGRAELWKWMNEFVKGNGTRRNGSLLAADYNYKEKAKRSFWEGLIEAIDFPKFDANDKNPANITITINAEKITYEKGDGHKLDERDPSITEQQHVAACNFDFVYDGVSPDVTNRVSKVDGFSLKCKIIEYHYAGRLEPSKQAGKIEYPPLVFYLPEQDARPFLDLHMQTVKGTRAPMKGASLSFFNNKRQERGKFTFKNCHIFNVSPEKQDASSEDVRLVKVECQIEGLEVDVK